MRYFFHIFDGSKLSPDDAGSNLPSREYAKRMAVVVADELKKGGELCRSSLVNQTPKRIRLAPRGCLVQVTSGADSHSPRERWFAVGTLFGIESERLELPAPLGW
jgi:hypothetical protein